MKTGIKLLKTATLVFLASASVFADDGEMSGEGRNGPDKSGVSIPVQVDKMLTTNQLEKAAMPCYLDQNKYILEQILRQKVEQRNAYWADWDRYAVFVKSDGKKPLCLSLSVGNYSFNGLVFFNILGGNSNFCEGNKAATYQVEDRIYELIDRLPLNGFFAGGIVLSVDSQVTIDELGSFNGKAVKSLQIIPSSIISRGDKLNPTSLKMNNEEFKQCLENNINQLN